MNEQVRLRYKVIRIDYVVAESRRDAIKAIEEDAAIGNPAATIFAVEDVKKGFWPQLIKQLFG